MTSFDPDWNGGKSESIVSVPSSLSVELETDIEPQGLSLGTFFFVIDKDYQIVLLVL